MTELTGPEKIRGIFFDFEGTLVNFQWRIVPAIKEVLEALELLGVTPRMLGGNPNYAQILNRVYDLTKGNDASAGTRALDLVHEVYDRYDADALTRWQLLPEAHAVLTTLKARKFKLAMVSNIGEAVLSTAMEKLHIKPFFDCVISRNHVSYLKPHPGGLIAAAGQVGIRPHQVLFVGDSVNDIVAARDAGMHAGYLVGGEDTVIGVEEQTADIRLKSLADLLSLA
ncbi:MAG: HAD family hydrolase [Desulfobacteraceae bacterium]|nr:HAD family hydrolase [Desulfobacteraceae bacterium]